MVMNQELQDLRLQKNDFDVYNCTASKEVFVHHINYSNLSMITLFSLLQNTKHCYFCLLRSKRAVFFVGELKSKGYSKGQSFLLQSPQSWKGLANSAQDSMFSVLIESENIFV